MLVVIAGSRSVRVADVYAAVEYSDYTVTEVISGTADGGDAGGELWALENNIPVRRRPAPWKRLGRRAGPFRNQQMAQETDTAIIVWDGVSRGTWSMVTEMDALGKPYELVGPIPSEQEVEYGGWL